MRSPGAWLAVLLAACGCSGTVIRGTGGAGGAAGAGAGGTAGASSGGSAAGGAAGAPCETAGGVRICGGTKSQCGWLSPAACPGGGCLRPYDRTLGGPARGGVCYSDLSDNGSRPCWGCQDGEACLYRAQDNPICVPVSVCQALWNIGVRGVCRYADYSAYDGRPLPRLASCPSSDPLASLCDGACPSASDPSGCAGFPCTGRSPDHPQGFCFLPPTNGGHLCALGGSGYSQACPNNFGYAPYYCGVFHLAGADESVARSFGQCMEESNCLALAKELPGGFDCYDSNGKLVKP